MVVECRDVYIILTGTVLTGTVNWTIPKIINNH